MKNFEPIGDLIYLISKELKKRLDEGLKHRNLGQGQSQTIMSLFKLTKNQEVTQDTLSKEMGINKANTSRNLNKLKQNGFIEILPDPNDQRKNNINLTEKSYSELKNIELVLHEIHNDMISDISESDLECTLKTLKKMKDNLYKK